MNIRITSWVSLVLLACAMCTCSHAQAVASSECVITEDWCPCSQAASSGSCLKYQGESLCLLGMCRASYKCDCLGYEKCKRSSCAVYTAMENTIPSELVPFGCHLTAGAGSCTSFDSFLDTVEAAVNAKTDARHSNNEATAESVNAHRLVSEVQGEAASINDELNAIEALRDQMTVEEEEEIYDNARIVQDSVKNCTLKALDVTIEAGKAFETNLKTGEMAGVAVSSDKDCKRKKDELKEEEEKAKSEKKECSACQKLEEDIEVLEKLSKEAAVNAGKGAKSCKGNKDSAADLVQEIREKRMNCGLARGKVLSAIAKLKKRLNQA
ncbi:hypothetical protein FGB62_22g64 [Gracilaria domingensis]|nr:hypothetical protein FGB62_22g64 [Gracilaria domingensis]